MRKKFSPLILYIIILTIPLMSIEAQLQQLESLNIESLTLEKIQNLRNAQLKRILLQLLNERSAQAGGKSASDEPNHSSHNQAKGTTRKAEAAST
jgi:hypothetical protein